MRQGFCNIRYMRTVGRQGTHVQEVLLKARDRIVPAGRWCQGTYRDGEALCPVAAVEEYAVPGTLPWQRALVRLRRAMDGTDSVTRWNDVPGRSHQEVLAAFGRALGRQPVN